MNGFPPRSLPAGSSGFRRRGLRILAAALLAVQAAMAAGPGRMCRPQPDLSDLVAGRHNTTPVTACTGYNPGTLSFTTPVSGGTPPYLYQWQLNGTDIPGETTDAYNPPRLDAAGTYRYNCRISDQEGNRVWTDPKVITIQPDPEVVINGGGVTCLGSGLALQAVIAGGTGTYSYQWQVSEDNTTFTDIPGADSAAYAPAVDSAGTRFYRIRLYPRTGSCNNATSAEVPVIVTAPPATSPIYHL